MIVDLEAVPWLAIVQGQWPLIRAEMEHTPSWVAWGSDRKDSTGHCAFLDGEWTVFPVYFGRYDGRDRATGHPGFEERAEELCASLPGLYPGTTALLRPLPHVNYAAFTRLHAGSRLAPHRHRNPHSLILHLGLVIPAGETCGLSVGDRIHLWRAPGDAVVFNDNLDHAAWNDSDTDRILFYLDFVPPTELRPEVPDEP